MGAVPEPLGTLPACAMAHGEHLTCHYRGSVISKSLFFSKCLILRRCQTNSLGTNHALSII